MCELKFPKRPPARSKKYLDYIRSLPCCLCHPWVHKDRRVIPHYEAGGQAHHYGRTGKGTGQKCSDFETVPVCAYHHGMIETPGNSQEIVERRFHVSFIEVGETYRGLYGSSED